MTFNMLIDDKHSFSRVFEKELLSFFKKKNYTYNWKKKDNCYEFILKSKKSYILGFTEQFQTFKRLKSYAYKRWLIYEILLKEKSLSRYRQNFLESSIDFIDEPSITDPLLKEYFGMNVDNLFLIYKRLNNDFN